MKLSFVFLTLILACACTRPAPAPSAPPRPDPLATCLPEVQTEGNLRLGISGISNDGRVTNVRVVFYAVGGPTDFAVPVYYMSRGRWMIDEKHRAYLLDSECREYKLQDRHETKGMDATPDGRMKLKPGEAFETTLEFPALSPKIRHGLLVYGTFVLPFSLLPTPAPSPSPTPQS